MSFHDQPRSRALSTCSCSIVRAAGGGRRRLAGRPRDPCWTARRPAPVRHRPWSCRQDNLTPVVRQDILTMHPRRMARGTVRRGGDRQDSADGRTGRQVEQPRAGGARRAVGSDVGLPAPLPPRPGPAGRRRRADGAGLAGGGERVRRRDDQRAPRRVPELPAEPVGGRDVGPRRDRAHLGGALPAPPAAATRRAGRRGHRLDGAAVPGSCRRGLRRRRARRRLRAVRGAVRRDAGPLHRCPADRGRRPARRRVGAPGRRPGGARPAGEPGADGRARRRARRRPVGPDSWASACCSTRSSRPSGPPRSRPRTRRPAGEGRAS